ncbi:hypothetical protein [Catenuloplanes indicus]|uniref:Tetratricopeptide repeat protein n=1 Tax=Catenuloplanes indicus TaxID=137267 RepID=A0AAE3VW78_9ACTN|nr:hypothetical protein [Catenuloplanes indicus]MDQ0364871.1 hypothetical protein [Catenuloplanes indicus]
MQLLVVRAATAGAVALHREAGDRYHEADTLIHLGDCHRDEGDPDAARAAWGHARRILTELRHPAAATVEDRFRTRCDQGATRGNP